MLALKESSATMRQPLFPALREPQYYVYGFADGNEVLRPDKAFGWSQNVEIAVSWRGPTRQACR